MACHAAVYVVSAGMSSERPQRRAKMLYFKLFINWYGVGVLLLLVELVTLLGVNKVRWNSIAYNFSS